MLFMTPKSCNQRIFSSELLLGHGSEERKLRVLQQLDCIAHTTH